MSGRLVPFYSYEGAYLDHITIKRAERLEEMGRVKVVRHRKGHVNRAVLLRGAGEPHATKMRDYVGQAYSFHQPLIHQAVAVKAAVDALDASFQEDRDANF